jgi:hypothetical protein
MSLLIPLLMLGLAVASAIGYALARGWGLAAVAALVIAGGVAVAMQSDNHMMAVAYIAAFALPVFLAAGALGAWAGGLLRRGRFGVALLPLIPIAAFIGYHAHNTYAEKAEEARAREFVLDNAQLAQMVGGAVKANLTSRTTYANGAPGHYEFALKARQSLYAIVQVDRRWFGDPSFHLQCVTTLSMGQRQAGRSPCDEGMVSFNDTRFALPPEKSQAELRAEAKARAEEKRAAEEHLARQLAKVQAATAAEAGNRPLAASVAAGASPAAGPAFKAVPPPGTPVAGPPAAGPLSGAEVAVVGVYQSGRSVKGAPGTRDTGPVQVNVAPGSTPLVLVLASYEPVQWQVNNRGRKIAAVLLSGYYPSTVTGVAVPVTPIGTQYAYKPDSAEWPRLQAVVARHAPNPPRYFLGAYAGTSFDVPGN